MRRLCCACLAGLAVSGCDSPQLLEPSAAVVQDVKEEDPTASALPALARGLAIAMADDGLRVRVRDAMKGSPWGQHVIGLQAFLESPLGAGVSVAMGRSIGLSQEDFHQYIQTLSALDLYIPEGRMRRTWRGGDDIAVFASMDFDSLPVSIYSVGGEAQVDLAAPYEATFLIEPAGRRIPRFDIDAGSSLVVEGPNEVAFYYRFVDADGTVTEGSYTDLLGVSATQLPGGPMAAPSSNGNTGVKQIESTICDALGGDLEVVLKTWFYDEAGALVKSGQIALNGVDAPSQCRHDWDGDSYSSPYPVLLSYVLPPGASHKIRIEFWEDDIVGDDYYGSDDVFANDFRATFWDNGPRCDWGDQGWIWPEYYGECANVYLNMPSISTSTLSSVVFNPVTVVEGGEPETATAKLYDQYGFGLSTSGYTATGWGTASSYYATAEGLQGVLGSVYGQNAGSTTYFATVGGVQGSATVTVDPCVGHECGGNE